MTLVVSEDKLENLSFAMQNMLTEPIEKDYLFLYPTIESFSKKADNYYFKFYLRGSESVIDEYYK